MNWFESKSKNWTCNVGLLGSSGRMGQELLSLLSTDPEFSNWHLALDIKDLEDPLWVKGAKNASLSVIIDFSSPKATLQCLRCLRERDLSLPFVSGTTGFSPTQKEELQGYGEFLPLLWSPNMSLGIALLKRALGVFAELPTPGSFDFQVEEIHHRGKKDAPSGTALWIQEELERRVGPTVGPPLSLRGGGVFGVHRLYALAQEEEIIFEHRAFNRRVFARGALRVAAWLLQGQGTAEERPRRTGFFTMDDIFK